MLACSQDAIYHLDQMHGPKLPQQKSLPKTRHGKQAASEKQHAKMTATVLALRMLSAAFGNAKSQVEFRHQIGRDAAAEQRRGGQRGGCGPRSSGRRQACPYRRLNAGFH